MWKCIISMFKGLKQQMNHEFLLSYKMTFAAAMCHPNSDIKSATQSIFEIKDGLNDKAKSALEEIKETIEKSASHSKSDSIKRKQTTEQAKEVRICGSFLNRKSTNKMAISDKQPAKNDKACLLSEPDSQVNNLFFYCTQYIIFIFFSDILYNRTFAGLCVHKNGIEI